MTDRKLTPETIFSSPLSRLFVGAGMLLCAGWYTRGQFNELKDGQTAMLKSQAEMKETLETKVVTWEQAKLYAAKFDAANRGINITVPEPNTVR